MSANSNSTLFRTIPCFDKPEGWLIIPRPNDKILDFDQIKSICRRKNKHN